MSGRGCFCLEAACLLPEAERAVGRGVRDAAGVVGPPERTRGEAWDVMSQLPKDLKKLWLGVHQRLAEFRML